MKTAIMSSPSQAILAADTSTRQCTVALCLFSEQGAINVAAQTSADSHRLHAEGLLDALQWVLHAAGRTLRQVDCLAVSIGPGSFTGLRVGAAAWKGLAFALNLPLVAVPTLDAMSRLNAVVDGVVAPMLDARMGEVFGAVYRFSQLRREKLTPDLVCSAEELLTHIPEGAGPVLLPGDGALRYRADILACLPEACILPETMGTPRADAVAVEARHLLLQGVEVRAACAAPRYLRASQAEQARELKLAAEHETQEASV